LHQQTFDIVYKIITLLMKCGAFAYGWGPRWQDVSGGGTAKASLEFWLWPLTGSTITGTG